jgi:hypothetical protein
LQFLQRPGRARPCQVVTAQRSSRTNSVAPARTPR